VKTFSILLSITISIYGFLQFQRKRLSLILVLVFFCCFLLFYSFIPIHQIVYSVMLLREEIGQNDWLNMFCCLQTIKHCSPLGPILIIRDIKHFDSNTLTDLLSSLNVLKKSTQEGVDTVIKFPVILETDNLWMGEVSMQFATAAFHYYVLEEMSYEEGKKEVVTKHQLFNETLYNSMYESFRGHARFYTFVWEHMFRVNRTYSDTLNGLTNECQVLIHMCLIHCVNYTETVSFLKKLLANNFSLENFKIHSSTIAHLIQCNLLYHNLVTGTLRVQNRLLEIVLTRILEKRNL